VIRVVLPYHLRGLAQVSGEVELDLAPPVTLGALLAALEECHPVLRGTIREIPTGRRRPLVRFFAAGEDLSFATTEAELPPSVTSGAEPFLVVGAMAGG